VWVSRNILLFLMVRYRIMLWQSTTVVMTGTLAAVLATGAGAILVVQYSRRRTAMARTLTAAVAAAVLGVMAAGHRVFGLPPHAAGSSNAHIVLDRDPARRSSLMPSGRRDIAAVDIPVRIEGLPPGVVLDQETMVIRIEIPGKGDVLNRGAGGLHDISGSRAWLVIFPDRALVDRTRSQPVTVSGAFDFRRFDSPRMLPLPRGHRVVVPGIGVCRDSLEPEGWISFSCCSPSPRASLMIGSSTNRVNWIIPQGFVESSVPTASGFQPLIRFTSQLSYRSWEQIGDARLLAAQPLPPLRIVFRLSGIHWADYLVRGRNE
jgi:hypothetical protein